MKEEFCIMPDNPPYIEIWKDIPEYEGLYQVSNLGNVRSLTFRNNIVTKKRKKPLLMKYSIRSGYYTVNLRNKNGRKSYQVHRLVAQSFIDNQDNKPFVNHKDFNRKNNIVSNLEWCTQKENVRWSIDNMKHSKKFKNKLNEQYIRKRNNKYELTLKKKYIGTYNTLEEAINVKNKIIKGNEYYEKINNIK